ncbi:MAG: hypothetical protein R3B84_18295 [Zavarzinella sp.]
MSKDDHPTPRSRIAVSVLSNWLVLFATIASSFFLMPFLIRQLGSDKYGAWVMVESFLAYLMIFDIGIAAFIVRHVARSRTTQQWAELNETISTAWFVYLILGGGIILTGSIAVGIYELAAPTTPGVPLATIGWSMVLALGISLPLTLFSSILDGFERFGSKSLVRLLGIGLRAILLVIFLPQHPNLQAVAAIQIGTMLFENVGMYLLCRWVLPEMQIRRNLARRHAWRSIRNYTSHSLAILIGNRMAVQTIPMIIGALIGLAAVTWYAILFRLIDYARLLLRSASAVLLPRFSAVGKQSPQQVGELFLVSCRWSLYLLVIIAAGLICLGKPFLQLWLGPTILEGNSFWPLRIMAVVLPVAGLQTVATRYLYSAELLHPLTRWTWYEAIGVILLVPLGSWCYHLSGAIIAMSLVNLIASVGLISVVRNLLAIRWQALLQQAIRPMLAGSGSFLVWQLLPTTIGTWFTLIWVGASGTLAGLLLILMLEYVRKPISPARRGVA